MKTDPTGSEERDLKTLDHVLKFILEEDGKDLSAESKDKLNARVDDIQRSERRRRILRIYVPVAAVLVSLVALTVNFTTKAIDSGTIDCVNNSQTAMNLGLPDGTQVWLNPGGSLSYGKNFNKQDRCVTLLGDAYFDVAHDDAKAFIVDAGKFRVKVLGTVFNVQNCEDLHSVEVSLAQGSIAMQNADGVDLVRLRPGQQAVFDTESTTLEVRDVAVGDMLKRHYGVISLHEVTISEILKEIETVYNIKVSASNPDDQTTYNFSFQEASDIEDVVAILSFTCKKQEFTIIR